MHNLQITQHNVAMLTATKTEKGKTQASKHTQPKNRRRVKVWVAERGAKYPEKKQQHKRKLNENIK